MFRKIAVVVALMFSVLPTATAMADRAFAPRFTANDTGNILIVGNQLLNCDLSVASCAAARNGTAATLGDNNNNAQAMVRIDTDGDAATTLDSSTANLTLPTGAQVLFAGLYWGADTSAGAMVGTITPTAAPVPANANQVKLKAPGGTYATRTANQIDFGTGAQSTRFQGFANVTATVAAAGAGTYSVGDVQAGTGGDRLAGWSLVVVIRDPAAAPRNLTVFDGLTSVNANSGPVAIPVTGFRTPPAGAVRTDLGFIVYEGDLGIVGDTATLNGNTISNAANPATNYFNSSISRNGIFFTARNPSQRNLFGYDADILNADGVLGNNATNATIRVTTSGDAYLPGVITFATDLYAPIIKPAKAVANITHPGGLARRGDRLRYTVALDNSGQDAADDLRFADRIPTGTSFAPGSLRVTAGPGAPLSPSDASGDDTAEFDAANNRVLYRLGSGATATRGGTLAADGSPGDSTTISFDVIVDADVQSGARIDNIGTADFLGVSSGLPFTNDSNSARIVAGVPDLALTKTHTGTFVAGSRSTFRIVVSNVGDVATDGSSVTVSDTFPGPVAGFDRLENAGGTGWNCSVNGLTLTCTRADVLAANDSYPAIVVDAFVHEPPPASITNTTAVSGGGDGNLTNNTGTDIGPAQTQADVRVTKTATPDTVLSGQQVSYTLLVENLGPSTAQNVTVSDPLGASYAAISAASTRGTCTTAVSCTIGSLAVGETARVTITATVVANATTLTNTATASSTTLDPAPGNNSSSANVTVPNTADLAITKSASPANPIAGAVNGFTYTLSVHNNGPGAAAGIVVLDDLPALFTPSTITAPGFTCNTPAPGAELRCTLPTLANGATATITLVGTVAAGAAAQTLSNTVRVSAATGDPNPDNNTSSTSNLATPAADLSISKQWVGAANVNQITQTAPGSNVRIRLFATNNGPSPATNVQITDQLPANVTFVSSDNGACANAAGLITCTFANLAVGATQDILITVTIQPAAAGATLGNTADIDGTQNDPVDSNDSSTALLAVTPAADLTLTKSAASPSANVGAPITYTLSYTNNGPNTATATTIADTLPPNVAFVSASGPCTFAPNPGPSGTVTCSLGALADGATGSVTIVVTPTAAAAGTALVNSATIDAATIDPVTSDNTDTFSVSVAPRADLTVTKTPSTATPRVDQDLAYTLTVTNNGPNDATGVDISDALPAGVRFISASPGCSYAAATTTVSCAIGDIADGATETRTITVRAGLALAGQGVTNAASVAGDQDDPVPANNTSTSTVNVQPEADLSITKTSSTASAQVDTQFTYTLVVTNDGPSTATAVAINDPLPAGLTAGTPVPSQGTCTASATSVTCALGSIPSGGTAQVVVPVVAAALLANQSVVNTATVTSALPDPRLVNNSSTNTTAITPAPIVIGPPAEVAQLRVTKVADRSTATVDDQIVYTLTVENLGPSTARQVALTDTPSRDVRVDAIATSAGACAAAAVITCDLGDIASGATVTVTITVHPLATGQLSNVVSATSSTPAPAGSAVPTASADVNIVTSRTTLTVHKRAKPIRVRGGAVFTYAMTVRNAGHATALKVRVCDRLPAGVSFVRARNGALRSGSVCWSIGSISPGRSRTVSVTVRAFGRSTVTRIRNTATATATNAATARGSVTTTVLRGGLLAQRGGGVTG